MNIIGIIQARMSSTRLPEKILKDLCGKPLLLQVVERIRGSKYLNKVIIATSDLPEDDVVEQFTKENRIDLFRGSLSDVLSRFYHCAAKENADIVVRFTGDNPMLDPVLIDEGIEYFLQHREYDYIKYRDGLPLGMAFEVFTYQALEKSFLEASDPECREHVTPYMYRNPGLFHYYNCGTEGEDYSQLRWTVDTVEDYQLVKAIYESLYFVNPLFGLREIIEKYNEHPEWEQMNNRILQKQVLYKGNER